MPHRNNNIHCFQGATPIYHTSISLTHAGHDVIATGGVNASLGLGNGVNDIHDDCRRASQQLQWSVEGEELWVWLSIYLHICKVLVSRGVAGQVV